MRRLGIKAGFASSLALCAALLIILPPERYGFYPRCPIFEATGWLCPGCGGTRALAALLHGNFQAAWRLNALIVSLLPFAATIGVLRICRKQVKLPRGIWAALGLIVAMFAISRNL